MSSPAKKSCPTFDEVDSRMVGRPVLTSQSSGPSRASNSSLSTLSPVTPGAAGIDPFHASSHPSSATPGGAGVEPLQYRPPPSSLPCSSIDEDPGGTGQDNLSYEVVTKQAAANSESLPMVEEPFDYDNVSTLEFDRLRSFLSKVKWACQYYDEDDGFHVAIRDISEHEARRQVDEQQFLIPVIFNKPVNRKYEQCVDVNPGDRLNDPPGKGVFSGTVGTSPQQVYGLTAAHAANQQGTCCRDEETKLRNGIILSNNESIVIDKVYSENLQFRYTADVRLLNLEPDVKCNNAIHIMENIPNIPNGTYKPTLYQFHVRNLRNRNIALRNSQRQLMQGSIRNCSYTDEDENIFNTIAVIGIPNSDTPIIVVPGDSGALVWLIPPAGAPVENVVEVVGIVLGRLVTNDAGELWGMVNNLQAVLVGYSLNSCGVFGTGPNKPGFYDRI